MDSHHDQVMKARAGAGSGTRLYFAYSTLLDREAFDGWRAQHGYEWFTLPEGRLAEAQDVAVVFDFPSRFWGGRVAGLADRQGATVFGRLFEIAEKDFPVIQHKEGAVTGMCVEREVKVKVGEELLTAVAFATNPARARSDGEISKPFVEALLRGATSAALPAAYLESLRAAAK